MTAWGGHPQEGLGKLVRTDVSWKMGSAALRVAEGGRLTCAGGAGMESSLRESGHSASVYHVTLKSALSLGSTR